MKIHGQRCLPDVDLTLEMGPAESGELTPVRPTVAFIEEERRKKKDYRWWRRGFGGAGEVKEEKMTDQRRAL
jgi:hypothetical protein